MKQSFVRFDLAADPASIPGTPRSEETHRSCLTPRTGYITQWSVAVPARSIAHTFGPLSGRDTLPVTSNPRPS